MKKALFVLFIIIIAGVVFFLTKNKSPGTNSPVPAANAPQVAPRATIGRTAPLTQDAAEDNRASGNFQPPLDRAAERVSKKPFGIFITPQNSPVQPEKFRGYHTGTDFEIFPDELDADVLVRAACSGTIAAKRTASGYGGVLVQNCMLDNQPIGIIYGHLKLASITKKTGDTLDAGETIGILGKSFSSETDGERKHLHLGIRKGSSISILGYTGSQSQLSGWIDSCSLICK